MEDIELDDQIDEDYIEDSSYQVSGEHPGCTQRLIEPRLVLCIARQQNETYLQVNQTRKQNGITMFKRMRTYLDCSLLTARTLS